ncbi:hypothetical protein AAHA92_20181 [Salvia divinorum]|uniref:Uncharacterized protein n=1 Tax=Salvia divinorum TaxID=28513 RepID=A0ABD1GGD1_SALDI
MAFQPGSGNSSSSKQKQTEEDDGVTSTLKAVGAAVGVAAVAWSAFSYLFGRSEEKMMKAPGKNYSIPRKDFESNPAEWFRNNRS